MTIAAALRSRLSVSAGWGRKEILLAAGAFAVLCIAVLSVKPQLMEPDDYAYRGSILAMTQGHLLTLSTAQARALAAQLANISPGQRIVGGPGGGPPGIALWQWVQLPDGRWISEKNPGYPYLAAPFQALGIIRLAPLFYGALGCLGLYLGGRRWLGPTGGAAAVGLFCSSGAAIFYAWRDYMPTFTEASLIAAGMGALLWAMLGPETAARRRTWAGLLGFVAIEAAVFARYTNIVVLGCAVVVVLAARWRRPASVPPGALRWWLGSAVLFGIGAAVFNDLVYGGPFKSGYRPGDIAFSPGAVLPNLRYMPARLIEAMPVLLFALAGMAWIAGLRTRSRRPAGDQGWVARRDFAVGLALAASWVSVWGLYAAYTWTAHSGLSTFQTARFYVPVIGAISLLGAWALVRVPGRALPATATAVIVAMFGLGIWSATQMRAPGNPHPRPAAIPAADPRRPGCDRSQRVTRVCYALGSTTLVTTQRCLPIFRSRVNPSFS
jgi:hypothetical protein